MKQLEFFKNSDLCQCETTIAKNGRACAVCRMEQMLDFNYVSNMLDIINEDPFTEVSDEDAIDD